MRSLRALETDSLQSSSRGKTDLPPGWLTVSISDVVEQISNTKPEEEPDRTFNYVDISCICNSTFRIVRHKAIKGSEAPSRARRPIRAGDILFSNVRTYLRNIAIVPDNTGVDLCSTGFTVLRSNGTVNPRFLFCYVLTDTFIDRVSPQQTGTHYPATSDRVVMAETIPLPPLAEQQRIVAKVDKLLTRVSAARERLGRAPGILKRFRQSVLAAACSGRLTSDWRKELKKLTSVAPLLQAVGGEPWCNFGEGIELGEVPEEWGWVRFGDILAELKNGISTKPAGTPPGNPILRINAVRPGCVSFDDLRYLPGSDPLVPEYRLADGDLLFTRYNGSLDLLGVCGMVRGLQGRNMLYPDKLMRVRLRGNQILPEYCEAFFSEPAARDRMIAKAKSSAGQNGVSGTDVKNQPIALPPIPEQREIVRRLEALFKLADAIEKRVAAATQRAEKLTQAILAKAFRGELVPTEAELARQEGHDYEPASALLERIRAELVQATKGAMTRKPGRAAPRTRRARTQPE